MAIAAVCPAAVAQAQRIAVVPSAVGDAPLGRLGAAAEAIGAELGSRDSIGALASLDAARRFAAAGSSEPSPTEEDDLAQLARCTEQALFQVASGRRQQARRTVEDRPERAERALESLNRESAAARNVFDGCLYGVRALLESGSERLAYDQALHCRRLVPDLAPSEPSHPDDVIRLIRRAEQDLEAAPHGALRVESEPSACPVFVNGRRLGVTPLELDELPAGPYRLQVECRGLGSARVHRIELGATDLTVRIVDRFESAVRTHGSLAMVYSSVTDAERNRLEDGVRVAETLGADEAWLVAVASGERDPLRIDRVLVSSRRVVASAWLDVSAAGTVFSRGTLALAIEALLTGRSTDFTGEAPRERPTWQPPPSRDAMAAARPQADEPVARDRDATSRQWPDGEAIGGLVTTALGAAAVIAGFATWSLRQDEFTRSVAAFGVGASGEYESIRGVPVALVGAGALLGAIGIPLWLPPEDGVPWWSWVVGGLGLVAGGTGIAMLADGCPQGDAIGTASSPAEICSHDAAAIAVTWFSLAVPFVTVPITYAIREAIDGSAPDSAPASVAVSISVSSEGGFLRLGGAF